MYAFDAGRIYKWMPTFDFLRGGGAEIRKLRKVPSMNTLFSDMLYNIFY